MTGGSVITPSPPGTVLISGDKVGGGEGVGLGLGLGGGLKGEGGGEEGFGGGVRGGLGGGGDKGVLTGVITHCWRPEPSSLASSCKYFSVQEAAAAKNFKQPDLREYARIL